MDALAQGYGTDSSEGSMNHHHASTLGLLANYSNESDASDADADEPTTITPKNQTATNEPSHDHIHLVKKPKLSKSNADTVGNEDAVSTCPGLPPPKLLSTVHKNSSSQEQPILFAKNYLQHKLTYNTSSTSTNSNSDLVEKLTRLAQNETSFADQLKSQTEFGNPHMFHSIIDHFGIDPMENNVHSAFHGNGHGNQKVPAEKETYVSGKSKQFENFEFLERLLVKEEENRVRQGSST